MDAIETLRRVVLDNIKANVPVQTVWATCTSVDPDRATMEAARDGVEYFDVLLGIGSDMVTPVVGSKVLIGLVENKGAATFLILAESYDRRDINGNAFGGLVKADSVAERLAHLENDLNQLKQLWTSVVPVPNDGGLAIKTHLSAWSAQSLSVTTSQELQNTVVNHG